MLRYASALSVNTGRMSSLIPRWKLAIFRKVKEIKYLSGGVVLYAAPANAQTDAEIAEKGSFQKRNILTVFQRICVGSKKLLHKPGLKDRQINRTTKFSGNRGNLLLRSPAGHDQIKGREIVVDVQSNAVG